MPLNLSLAAPGSSYCFGRLVTRLATYSVSMHATWSL
jgi:hypothetical protein